MHAHTHVDIIILYMYVCVRLHRTAENPISRRYPSELAIGAPKILICGQNPNLWQHSNMVHDGARSADTVYYNTIDL